MAKNVMQFIHSNKILLQWFPHCMFFKKMLVYVIFYISPRDWGQIGIELEIEHTV